MDITSKSMLLGGLGTAVVAAWSQFRSLLRYISSALVIQAELDHNLSYAVMSYLYSHYKPLPSGLFTFYSIRFKVRTQTRSLTVPFQLWNSTCIVHRGSSILYLSQTEHSIRLASIRGFADFGNLVSEALDFDIRYNSATCSSNTRYRVIPCVGSASERGNYGNTPKRRGASLDDEPQEVTSRSALLVHPNLLTSFKYHKRQYIENTQVVDPFDDLYYPDPVVQHIEDVVAWRSNSEWFLSRSIPWRRGWLLWGPGGAGKSSLAKATAQKLDLPLYQYYLSTLTDTEFMEQWSQMNTPCMALLEDFDNVFHGRENMTEHKLLSFDCVLNMLSGVNSQDGVFVVITTNRIDMIDDALGVSCNESGLSTRPGRIDTVIYLGYADEDCRRKIAQRVLRDWPDEIEDVLAVEGDFTPVQMQEICVQRAFRRIHGQEVNHG